MYNDNRKDGEKMDEINFKAIFAVAYAVIFYGAAVMHLLNKRFG